MKTENSILMAGNKVCYAEYGDPDGIPVFFFHGWPGSRLQGEIAHEVSQRLGIHLITPDRPGMGQSDYNPERKILDWPDIVVYLADKLGWNHFNVLGLSGGTPYTLACTYKLPDRIEKAGICSAVPHYDWLRKHESAIWYLRRLILMEDNTPGALYPWLNFMKSYISLFSSGGFLKPASLILKGKDKELLKDKRLVERAAASIREGFSDSPKGLWYDLKLLISDWEIEFANIEKPIQYWHGEKDTLCPLSELDTQLEKNSRFNLYSYREEGHYSLPVNRMEDILGYFTE